jgi:copper homeostasis protein
LYSAEEYEIMKGDIQVCKQLGCDGVVIGILSSAGAVDKVRCEKLVSYAYPLGVTFHRAFDRTTDPFEALENIMEIGCERILTSGQQPKAFAGKQLIRDLIVQAGERIVIMPGSGITSENIISIAESTGAEEFHSSASMYKNSKMEYHNAAMKELMKHHIVNKEEVYKMSELLRNHGINDIV